MNKGPGRTWEESGLSVEYSAASSDNQIPLYMIMWELCITIKCA